MELVRWIGFGAFFLSSLVIGVRLLLLARRTGQIPELLIGLGVLGIGPLGYGLVVLAFAAASQQAVLSAALMGSGQLALNVGAASQYLFIWRVFRRAERWAGAVFYAAVALLAASFVGDVLQNGLLSRRPDSAWFWLGIGVRLGCLAWQSLESLGYFARMQRRAQFGLGDPVVANRFLLWGLGAGAAFTGSLVGLAPLAISGTPASTIPLLSLIVSLHGLAAAVAMWLAFLPPRAYLRFVAGRKALAPG